MRSNARSRPVDSVFDAWAAQSLRWWALLTAAVSIGLLLLLLAATSLDGALHRPFDSVFWRANLLGPVLITYILAVEPVLRRTRLGAIDAFRGLVVLPPDAFGRLVAGATPPDRPRSWLALGICGGLGVLILRPWQIPDDFFWTRLYRVVVAGLMCGLGGSVMLNVLSGARLLRTLHRQTLHIDVFDPSPLEPIARRSLFLAFILLGAISIGLVVIPEQDTRGFILNGLVIGVAVGTFFLTLRDTHRVMAAAKRRELKRVRHELATAYRSLTERAAQGQLDDLGTLPTLTSLWSSYEKRIDEAPEWPFTGSMLRRLAVSTLIPVLILTSQRLLVETLIKQLFR